MTAIDDSTAQAALEDSPSIAAVVTSPREFTRETLAGVVTALALIPEVISFSFVSGVDPKVALVASIVLCIVMSVLGGRPAMVTAAAGSIALVIGPMVKVHGVGYILPTIILAGIIQIAFGLAGLARLTRFIPRSVMIGFVNALGILIFAAQVPHIFNVPWLSFVRTDDCHRPRHAAHHDISAGAARRHHRGDVDRDRGASDGSQCRRRGHDGTGAACYHRVRGAARLQHAAHHLADRHQRRLCRAARDAADRQAG
jgi:hypothetical protein